MSEPSFSPVGWSVERPFDFGDVLDREPPTYEDDDDALDAGDEDSPS
jgi:hypothetical protein